MMIENKECISKLKEMRETNLIITGQNRGFKSPITDDNHGKPILNARSRSDNKIVCKLFAGKWRISGIKNGYFSKIIGAYF
jgi:hypothetical protein